MEMIERLWHKITYALLIMLKETLVAVGVIFGLYQGITFFFPTIQEKITGWCPLLIGIFISVIYGRFKTWKSEKITINIPHSNTKIVIIFGDLFKQEGLKVIPVNEFFDSEIGKPVSNKTLHGILITEHLRGKTFDDVIRNQLDKIEPVECAEKVEGRNKCYPIGTAVRIETDGSYLAFSLSKTTHDTCKAYCDVAIMWTALKGLWEKARIESGGVQINVPLVGSGQSGVGLPARDLLNLIILSAVTETKKERITGNIRIILQYDYFDKLDLRDIKRYWKE